MIAYRSVWGNLAKTVSQNSSVRLLLSSSIRFDLRPVKTIEAERDAEGELVETNHMENLTVSTIWNKWILLRPASRILWSTKAQVRWSCRTLRRIAHKTPAYYWRVHFVTDRISWLMCCHRCWSMSVCAREWIRRFELDWSYQSTRMHCSHRCTIWILSSSREILAGFGILEVRRNIQTFIVKRMGRNKLPWHTDLMIVYEANHCW